MSTESKGVLFTLEDAKAALQVSSMKIYPNPKKGGSLFGVLITPKGEITCHVAKSLTDDEGKELKTKPTHLFVPSEILDSQDLSKGILSLCTKSSTQEAIWQG